MFALFTSLFTIFHDIKYTTVLFMKRDKTKHCQHNHTTGTTDRCYCWYLPSYKLQYYIAKKRQLDEIDRVFRRDIWFVLLKCNEWQLFLLSKRCNSGQFSIEIQRFKDHSCQGFLCDSKSKIKMAISLFRRILDEFSIYLVLWNVNEMIYP